MKGNEENGKEMGRGRNERGVEGKRKWGGGGRAGDGVGVVYVGRELVKRWVMGWVGKHVGGWEQWKSR